MSVKKGEDHQKEYQKLMNSSRQREIEDLVTNKSHSSKRWTQGFRSKNSAGHQRSDNLHTIIDHLTTAVNNNVPENRQISKTNVEKINPHLENVSTMGMRKWLSTPLAKKEGRRKDSTQLFFCVGVRHSFGIIVALYRKRPGTSMEPNAILKLPTVMMWSW